MLKLSDSQLVVLTAACGRDDGCAFPITPKLKGNAAGNVLKSLLAKGLLEEVPATNDDTVWRHDEDQGSLTLRATLAGHAALGIDAPDEAPAKAAQPPARGEKAEKARRVGTKRQDKVVVRTRAGRGKGSATSAAIPRKDTKQAQLIAMLRRHEGATIDDVVTTFGWQPHTVRGAIAGALKKNLGLAVSSEKIEGRGRVYRIAD